MSLSKITVYKYIQLTLLFITIATFTSFIVFRDELNISEEMHLYGEVIVFLLLAVLAYRLLFTLTALERKVASSEKKISNIGVQVHQLIADQFVLWELSPTETEIAHLILMGSSFKDIAEHRDINITTVYKHADNIYKKSSTSGRNEFVTCFLDEIIPKAESD